jgi:hypothetical protein
VEPTLEKTLAELRAKNVLLTAQPRDFFQTYRWDGRPFLLVGMGPSFSGIHNLDISGYNTLGLNKVVREIKVDLAHIIDYYIVDKVGKWLESNCTWIVSPYYPHFACRANPLLTLGQCISRHSLREKFLGYNLSTCPLRATDSPVVKANYFSAEAALNLVAHLGCKEVYAIGVDGGNQRAVEYADHGPCDPRGFDLQWEGMAKTINANHITYRNLDGTDLNPKLKEKLWQTS